MQSLKFLEERFIYFILLYLQEDLFFIRGSITPDLINYPFNFFVLKTESGIVRFTIKIITEKYINFIN